MEYNIKLHVNNLAIGMFISALDRPWIETPFPLQGLWIKSMRDIETLRVYCDNVYVDPNKSWIRIPDLDSTASYSWGSERKVREDFVTSLAKRGNDAETNPATVALDAELAHAKRIYSQSSALISEVLEDIRHNGKFDVLSVKAAAVEMVDSILRNSSALLWLSQLRNKNDYSYQHAINVCVLATAVGQHLSLPRNKLIHLATAGLLQDIGLLRLPSEIIQKTGPLTIEDQTLIRSHVENSVTLLSRQKGIPAEVIAAVAEHHERCDGSGYPRKLAGHAISLFGGITGICDCFDAMVSERHYAPKMSSFQALMVLYGIRKKAFSPALVERFIQCVGVYPIGSILELNTGEVAIVIEQRKSQRLKPRLLIVLDENKIPLQKPYALDLGVDPLTLEGEPYRIRDVLPCTAYGIDPTDYYLC